MEKLKLRQFFVLFFAVLICSIIFGFFLKSIELTNSVDYKIMALVQSNNIFNKNYTKNNSYFFLFHTRIKVPKPDTKKNHPFQSGFIDCHLAFNLSPFCN